MTTTPITTPATQSAPPKTIRLLSWNLAHRIRTWPRVVELAAAHQVDVALVQEATWPGLEAPTGLETWPPISDRTAWHTWDRPDSVGRYWCSALAWFPESNVRVEGETRVRLVDAKWDDPTISHPGQFAVGRLQVDDTPVLTVVSLYGIWDSRPDSRRFIFPEATLHRAISDLTPLLLTGDPILIAGDLNVCWDYGLDYDWYAPKTDTVRDRLRAYGVELAGPYRAAGTALDGCPCRIPTNCRHVPTRPTPSGVPLQLDWVLTNRAGAVHAQALPIEPEYSDHAPILIDVHIDQADGS